MENSEMQDEQMILCILKGVSIADLKALLDRSNELMNIGNDDRDWFTINNLCEQALETRISDIFGGDIPKFAGG